MNNEIENIKKEIIKNVDLKKLTLAELRKTMHVKGETMWAYFNNALNELEEEGQIYLDDEGYYKKFDSKQLGKVQGNIHIDRLGNGFVFIEHNNHKIKYLINEEKHLFINGNLTIDYDAKTIYINGVEVHFTNFEYKIIVLLAYNLGKTLTYDYIIDHVWGKDGQDQNGLRVFMAGIRKKTSRDNKSSKLIRTDIGVGYRMNKIK